MATGTVKCPRCTGGFAFCEHKTNQPHRVSSGPEIGKQCMPPQCKACRGMGYYEYKK